MNKFDVISGEAEDDNYEFSRKALQLLQIVQTRLSDYLGFSIIDLLIDTDAVVYGGAVRDSIAGLDIHDIDIMAMPTACKIIAERLISRGRGYEQFNYTSADVMRLYSGPDKIINEPLTFISGKKVVQLIRPSSNASSKKQAYDLVLSMVSNVDISACGVAFRCKYVDKPELFETVSGAFDDCKQHKFHVIKTNKLYRQDRISNRIAKLDGRGWKEETIDQASRDDIAPIRGFGFGDKVLPSDKVDEMMITYATDIHAIHQSDDHSISDDDPEVKALNRRVPDMDSLWSDR
jgi:hypothetical protein